MFRKILIGLLIVLVIIQFFRPARNKKEGAQPNFIANAYPMPADVKTIMSKACFDCHSNNTRYPWYSNFQPVLWWLNDHIKDGKKELNFDEFANKSARFQYRKMDEVIKEVKEKEMPLKSYTWVHKDAILSDDERNKVISWAEGVMDTMKSKYPADSLLKKGPPPPAGK